MTSSTQSSPYLPTVANEPLLSAEALGQLASFVCAIALHQPFRISGVGNADLVDKQEFGEAVMIQHRLAKLLKSLECMDRKITVYS